MPRARRIGGWTALAVAVLAIALFSGWAALALWYRLPVAEGGRLAAAAAIGAGGVATIVSLFTRRRWPALAGFGLLACAILLWWGSIRPPADADFAADVARQTRGRIEGDILTITDVREFAWRSDADFAEGWAERRYDLAKLESLDLFLSHWDDSGIAHMIMSFGFGDQRFLAWSVEVRRLRDGAFSPLADLFKSNPLVLIAAEERDVIGVRSNIRGEDVHRYALNLRRETMRKVLLEYVAEANRLAAQPAFYNSLTTNCTTSVVAMMRAVGATLPLDWRLVVNGRLPDYAFAHDALETGKSLAELKAQAPIGAKARAEGLTDSFSAAIRRP